MEVASADTALSIGFFESFCSCFFKVIFGEGTQLSEISLKTAEKCLEVIYGHELCTADGVGWDRL